MLERSHSKVGAKGRPKKRVNRVAYNIAKLEVEVIDMRRERDKLRDQLARKKAEAATLREMLKLPNSGRINAT